MSQKSTNIKHPQTSTYQHIQKIYQPISNNIKDLPDSALTPHPASRSRGVMPCKHPGKRRSTWRRPFWSFSVPFGCFWASFFLTGLGVFSWFGSVLLPGKLGNICGIRWVFTEKMSGWIWIVLVRLMCWKWFDPQSCGFVLLFRPSKSQVLSFQAARNVKKLLC